MWSPTRTVTVVTEKSSLPLGPVAVKQSLPAVSWTLSTAPCTASARLPPPPLWSSASIAPTLRRGFPPWTQAHIPPSPGLPVCKPLILLPGTRQSSPGRLFLHVQPCACTQHRPQTFLWVPRAHIPSPWRLGRVQRILLAFWGSQGGASSQAEHIAAYGGF